MLKIIDKNKKRQDIHDQECIFELYTKTTDVYI